MKTNDFFSIREQRRLVVQAELDAVRTHAERNRMGQFATSSPLAFDILAYAKELIAGCEKISFLDPALGTGAFYSSLLQNFSKNRVATASGYEIDAAYGQAASDLWADTGLNVHIADFTQTNEPASKNRFNLLICNPPYVRHHHIVNGEKARLQKLASDICGFQITGLSGLYCYFLFLSHGWMTEGGVAGWLIPSEFMDVNYGETVKRYLLDKVTLLHIHRFDPNEVQFDDALVSSAVVWFQNKPPPIGHTVRFSFGGTLLAPKVSRWISAQALRAEAKWTRFPIQEIRHSDRVPRVADFFSIRRGLATGDNNYFILTPEQISRFDLPIEMFRPILPSPRCLPFSEIEADEHGNPIIERPLFLLDCRLSESEVSDKYPKLWRYFRDGNARSVSERYLCRHRSPWYLQEKRLSTPFICTYMGRGNTKSGRPFRFILNKSLATVTNVYLALYPKASLAEKIHSNPGIINDVWHSLNRICPDSMISEGRVYGGGLHKLEPKELANVRVPELSDLLSVEVCAQSEPEFSEAAE